MTETKKTGGRERTGQLVWKASGWRGRVRIPQPDGTTKRTLIDLGTTNKGVAARHLKRLIRDIGRGEVNGADAAADVARSGITVSDFATEHYARRESLGVKTWRDEKRWFTRYVEAHIGKSELGHVEATDITDLVLEAVKAGRPAESLKKIRVECMRLFRGARKAKLIASSPVDDAEAPKLKARKLTRTLLTDEEFVKYVTHPHEQPWSRKSGKVDFEIKVRAIIARTIGGARTSDENALDWTDFDLVDFALARMYRPKTDAEDVYEVPEVARSFVREWWALAGCPTKGPVFPIRKGARAGQRRGKDSFAHRYRRDLLIAGVDRFELHTDTERTRRTDFHSFRRSFATALRRAKVDAREAMRLTAHTSYETHQGYVQDDGPILAPPAAALPLLPVPGVPVLPSAPANDTHKAASNGHGPCPTPASFIEKSVGVEGFEPTTAGTQSRPSTRLRYTPRGRGP